MLSDLGAIISDVIGPITFSILEIGALPLEGTEEPFYQLLDTFPILKLSHLR